MIYIFPRSKMNFDRQENKNAYLRTWQRENLKFFYSKFEYNLLDLTALKTLGIYFFNDKLINLSWTAFNIFERIFSIIKFFEIFETVKFHSFLKMHFNLQIIKFNRNTYFLNSFIATDLAALYLWNTLIKVSKQTGFVNLTWLIETLQTHFSIKKMHFNIHVWNN